MKIAALSTLAALAASPALGQAATVDKYYVVHNPDSNECTIEEQEPTDKSNIVDVFKTQTDAEEAAELLEICKPDESDD
jgi:hypothetical protein